MGFPRRIALRLARPLHVALRSQKVNLFLELVEPDRCERLLDVGGGTGVAGEFARLYERFENVTVLNLDPGCGTGVRMFTRQRFERTAANCPSPLDRLTGYSQTL